MINLEANWEALNKLVESYSDQKGQYGYLLANLRLDKEGLDGRWLGFKRAPAAKGNHHAFEGGLVFHLLEMWDLWLKLRPGVHKEPEVSDRRILHAIINHDIHKAYRTYLLGRYVINGIEDVDQTNRNWSVQYGDDRSDQLMPKDIKSIWLLTNCGVKLDDEQMNALMWAEGGFSDLQPKACSVLAKVAYLLDELSGNVLARIEKGTLLSHRRFSI